MAFGSSLPARIAQSSGTVRYLDASIGNDSNPGTEAQPWLTFAKAFTTLANGEKCLIKNGTYNDAGGLNLTSTHGGISSGVKTFEAYPGHSPVYANYLRWDGIQYFRMKGITFNAAFADSAGDTACYLVTTTAHIEFENCRIVDNPWGSGMVTDPTVDDVQWWNCLISNNGQTNTILDHGLYIKGLNHVVANCVVVGNSAFGVQLYNGGPVNAIVTNNTIVGNGASTSDTQWAGGIVLGTDSGVNACHDNKIYNNIIAFNTGWGIKSNSNVQAGANNVVDRNLIHSNSVGATSYASGGVTETNTITSDPLFINYAGGDYHLQAGSPAINRAVEAYAPATDSTGTGRS